MCSGRGTPRVPQARSSVCCFGTPSIPTALSKVNIFYILWSLDKGRPGGLGQDIGLLLQGPGAGPPLPEHPGPGVDLGGVFAQTGVKRLCEGPVHGASEVAVNPPGACRSWRLCPPPGPARSIASKTPKVALFSGFPLAAAVLALTTRGHSNSTASFVSLQLHNVSCSGGRRPETLSLTQLL